MALRYLVELNIDHLVDNLEDPTSLADRLHKLRARRETWADLSLGFEHKLTVDSGSDTITTLEHGMLTQLILSRAAPETSSLTQQHIAGIVTDNQWSLTGTAWTPQGEFIHGSLCD